MQFFEKTHESSRKEQLIIKIFHIIRIEMKNYQKKDQAESKSISNLI